MFLAKNNGTKGIIDIKYDSNSLISPNPTPGKFQISNIEQPISTIEIYNLLGEKVFEKSGVGWPKTESMEIDLSNQTSGIYFLKLNAEKGVVVRKIVRL